MMASRIFRPGGSSEEATGLFGHSCWNSIASLLFGAVMFSRFYCNALVSSAIWAGRAVIVAFYLGRYGPVSGP